MTRKRCRFIPRNDNAEDIELYNGLINYKESFKIKKICREEQRIG